MPQFDSATLPDLNAKIIKLVWQTDRWGGGKRWRNDISWEKLSSVLLRTEEEQVATMRRQVTTFVARVYPLEHNIIYCHLHSALETDCVDHNRILCVRKRWQTVTSTSICQNCQRCRACTCFSSPPPVVFIAERRNGHYILSWNKAKSYRQQINI